MSVKFDLDYFFAKFEAIPEEKWCTEAFARGVACCAQGHCGMRRGLPQTPPEAKALRDLLFDGTYNVVDVNDGHHPHYKQSTPKKRILAALRSLQPKAAQ